jgi:beta-N-acetylhexosaminidase
MVTTSAPAGPPPGELSVDQLAGQRVIYAYAGLQPPPSLIQAIAAGEAGGVIFFANNISSTAQIRSVIEGLQQASLSSPVHLPLLMLIDQEGGEVRRLPGPPVLSEKEIGDGKDPTELARSVGARVGTDLAGVGINVNLAPVLDVYRKPGNFIDQLQRSYSSKPNLVARLGGAFIAAQEQAGVAATAKHFPGLGSARQDQNTDLAPVTLTPSIKILRSVDEGPYRRAIAAGVKLVMMSWAVYPALDSHLPAGLSPSIIQGELRRRLGFRGVAITDSIDAGALTPFGSLAARTVRAAAAGADLILCSERNPNDNIPQEGLAAVHAIASAIARHRLGYDAAVQAARRIATLRADP